MGSAAFVVGQTTTISSRAQEGPCPVGFIVKVIQQGLFLRLGGLFLMVMVVVASGCACFSASGKKSLRNTIPPYYYNSDFRDLESETEQKKHTLVR
eukprot:scaffold2069_cov187-Amphora_coffeaeformis.AAC.39